MTSGELEKKLLGLRPEEVTNTILSEFDADPGSGRLTLFGSRVFLVRPELFINLQKQLERTVGPSAKGIVYLAGEHTGEDTATYYAQHPKFPKPRDDVDVAFRAVAEIWAVLGFGKFVLTRFTRAPLSADFRVENSSLAEAYGKSTRPVCHLFAGWGAGILRAVFAEEVFADEVRCAARGDPACEFEVRLVRSR